MSLFTDASLVYVPSGVKDGKTYSITPTDGSGDLTFSRGSDIEATRVAANGYIQKAQVNLLLQSNTFSNAAWTKTRSSLVGGQAGYDGTNDAWAFVDTADDNTHLMVQSFAYGPSVSTFSIYAKAGDVDFLAFRFEGNTGVDYAYFNLATGSLGTIDSDYIDAKITSVGGGWYRCSGTKLLPNIPDNQIVILPAQTNGDPTYAGAGTTAIYLQDAQVNYGLVAQTYQETTTAAVVSGITNDMPRLNYDPANPTCPSLLLEPSRTNLVTNDSYYDGTDWAKTRCTITTNASETTSPEGVYNASKMVSTDASESYVQDNVLLSTSGVFSFFAKKGDLDYCHSLVWDLAANGRRQWFNLATGEVGSTTIFGSGYDKVDAGMEDYGGGWYRCWFAWNNGNIISAVRINISSADADFSSPVDSYGYFYGCQVESAVTHPTSLIPTYGSSATRTADACSKTGIASLIGQSEGTIYVEFDNRLMTSYPNEYIFRIIGSDSDQIWLRKESGGAYFTARLITNSSTIIWTISSIPVPDGNTKIAISYKTGDSVLYLNGTQFGTSSATFSGTDFSDFYFNFSGTSNPELKLNQALLFTSRLSNADLATLTTL